MRSRMGLTRSYGGRDLLYWSQSEEFPLSMSPESPVSLGDERLRTYEADMRAHIALIRRMMPGVGFIGLHTTARCAVALCQGSRAFAACPGSL